MTDGSSNIKGLFLFFQVLKHPDKKFQIGQALKATVVGPDSSKAFLCLSLIGEVIKWYLVKEGSGVERSENMSSVLPKLKDAFSTGVPRV